MKRNAVFFGIFFLTFLGDVSWADVESDKDSGIHFLEKSQEVFMHLAEQVTPAVVALSSLPGGALHSFQSPEGRPNGEGRRDPRPPAGSGSGVIIDKNGLIVTNNHVVGEEKRVEVRLSDHTRLTGTVIGSDPDTDLAVVKIEGLEKTLPFVTFGDSQKAKVGQWVMAVGNPFGLDRTVTIGVISGLSRENVNLSRYENFIQTDASINPGNSGGPLFNIRGEVIGINTAIINVAHGIGFAIPSNMAQAVVKQLIHSGKVTRGWLGVGIQLLTPELAKKFNVKEEEGVLVSEVFEEDPAYQGGIQPGDIIVKVNEEPLGTPNTLARVIASFAPGEEVKIEFIRNGERHQLPIVLAERKAGAVPAAMPPILKNFFGLTVEDVLLEHIEKFKLKEKKGVVITGVESGSPADAVDLQKGDLIKEIEGEEIDDLNRFRALMEKVETAQSLLLRIIRDNRAFFVVLKKEEK